MTAESFNPFEPGEMQRAWPTLRALRERGPVAEIADGMCYVTRHAEAREVLRDHSTFRSKEGFRAPGVEVHPEDRLLGEQDPPEHHFMRRVAVQALSPASVRREEPQVRQTARDLLRDLRPGRVDLVPEFTVPLPNIVTVRILGFPVQDADQIAHWSEEVMVSDFPAHNRTERGEGFANAFPDYAGYIDRHIARAHTEILEGRKSTDLVTRLLQTEVDGSRLTDRQVRNLTQNMLVGGLTTTAQLLGNLLLRLIQEPETADGLRRAPERIEAMVEESLRTEPPVMFIPRGCVGDTEIGGTPIKAGTRVIVGVASANRDEACFTGAETFDPDRTDPEGHLTFGYGIHLCVGAPLARLVGRVGVEEFLARFPAGSIALTPDFAFENVPTYFEYGPARLTVDVTG